MKLDYIYRAILAFIFIFLKKKRGKKIRKKVFQSGKGDNGSFINMF
jgi:hypothetical protein